jgi:hypothetical protein
VGGEEMAREEGKDSGDESSSFGNEDAIMMEVTKVR